MSECWDLIVDFDAEPRRVPGGFVGGLCPTDARPIFPTRAARWTDEIFQPFLDRVNEDLATARSVGLYGKPDHGMWAKLLSNGAAPNTDDGRGTFPPARVNEHPRGGDDDDCPSKIDH
jgi:hypothetical protein